MNLTVFGVIHSIFWAIACVALLVLTRDTLPDGPALVLRLLASGHLIILGCYATRHIRASTPPAALRESFTDRS